MKTQVFLPFCLDSPTQTPHLSYNEIHRLTFRQVNTLCRNLVQTCLPSTLKVDIYAVPCVSCDKQYFDETGASLAKRISQHQFAVSRVHNNNAFCNHWDTGNQMDWSAARTVFPSETVSFISINLVLWVFYHTHIYTYMCVINFLTTNNFSKISYENKSMKYIRHLHFLYKKIFLSKTNQEAHAGDTEVALAGSQRAEKPPGSAVSSGAQHGFPAKQQEVMETIRISNTARFRVYFFLSSFSFLPLFRLFVFLFPFHFWLRGK